MSGSTYNARCRQITASYYALLHPAARHKTQLQNGEWAYFIINP